MRAQEVCVHKSAHSKRERPDVVCVPGPAPALPVPAVLRAQETCARKRYACTRARIRSARDQMLYVSPDLPRLYLFRQCCARKRHPHAHAQRVPAALHDTIIHDILHTMLGSSDITHLIATPFLVATSLTVCSPSGKPAARTFRCIAASTSSSLVRNDKGSVLPSAGCIKRLISKMSEVFRQPGLSQPYVGKSPPCVGNSPPRIGKSPPCVFERIDTLLLRRSRANQIFPAFNCSCIQFAV